MNDMAVRLDPRDPTLRLRAAEDRVIREFLECGGRRVRITRSGDVNTCDPRDELDRGADCWVCHGSRGDVLRELDCGVAAMAASRYRIGDRFMLRRTGHVVRLDANVDAEGLTTNEHTRNWRGTYVAGPAGEVLLSERFMRAHGHVMEPDRDKGFELLLTEEGGQCGER